MVHAILANEAMEFLGYKLRAVVGDNLGIMLRDWNSTF